MDVPDVLSYSFHSITFESLVGSVPGLGVT